MKRKINILSLVVLHSFPNENLITPVGKKTEKQKKESEKLETPKKE